MLCLQVVGERFKRMGAPGQSPRHGLDVDEVPWVVGRPAAVARRELDPGGVRRPVLDPHTVATFVWRKLE